MISFARPQRDNVETYTVDIALFVGLALVLIIILIVMAPLATVDIASNLQSTQPDRTTATPNLPASTADPQRPGKALYLTIKFDLTLALGNDPDVLGSALGRDVLGSALDAAASGDKDTRILIRADRAVSYGDVIEVINLLRAAGYLKVALVGLF